jgi:hypothetical protein
MTSCPTFDRLADAAFDGDRNALARLDAHVDACDACQAVALDDDALDGGVGDAGVASALASLGAVACPPAVVDAALRQARRSGAPDRRPLVGALVAPRRRLAVGLAAFVCALVVALVATGRFAPAPADAPPPVADASAQTPEAPAAVDLGPSDLAVATPAPEASTPTVAPDPSPAPRVRSAPRRRPAARHESDAPAPLVASVPDAMPTVAEASPSAADSAAAVAGMRLAFTLVGRARQDALDAVAPELQRPQATLASIHLL